MRTRKSQQTGARITVGTAEEMELDPTDGKWVTVCEDHGLILNHRTRKLAEWHAADPIGWCEGCQERGITGNRIPRHD